MENVVDEHTKKISSHEDEFNRFQRMFERMHQDRRNAERKVNHVLMTLLESEIIANREQVSYQKELTNYISP